MAWAAGLFIAEWFLASTMAAAVTSPLFAGFVRRLENLEWAQILRSEFKALKVLEFPKLSLKSLEYVDVDESPFYLYLYA